MGFLYIFLARSSVRMSNPKAGRPPAHPVPSPENGRAVRDEPPRDPVARPRPDERAATAIVRLEVSPGDPPEHLFRRLLAAYLGGADVLELNERSGISGRTRDVAREFCRRAGGAQVVRGREGSLEIVGADPELPGRMDDRLRGLGRQVLGFQQEAVASWGGLTLEDGNAWERRDDPIDRDAWKLERDLARASREGVVGDVTTAGTIVRSLERIADHAVTLGVVGSRLADVGPEGAPLHELRQFHAQAMRHLEEVLRGPDVARANDLLDVGEALLTGGRALAERVLAQTGEHPMAPATAAAVARAFEAISRTVAYGQDIAQAYLDRAFRDARAPPAVEERPGEARVPA
jgi:hypothetical protein